MKDLLRGLFNAIKFLPKRTPPDIPSRLLLNINLEKLRIAVLSTSSSTVLLDQKSNVLQENIFRLGNMRYVWQNHPQYLVYSENKRAEGQEAAEERFRELLSTLDIIEESCGKIMRNIDDFSAANREITHRLQAICEDAEKLSYVFDEHQRTNGVTYD